MWKSTFACSTLNEPDFEKHPSDWFDWFDNCMSGDDGGDSGGGGGGSQPPPCIPKKNIIINGECYERVCTADGPELRPCFKSSLPPVSYYNILAIRINRKGYVVQVQSAKGIHAQTVKHGTIKLRDLGAAMIYKVVLPNADLSKIHHSFWKTIKKLSGKVKKGKVQDIKK